MAEVIVRMVGCEAAGGETTVPAGDRIVVQQGWGAKNRGQMQTFLKAQTTTISIDGGDPVDVSNSYSAIQAHPDGGFVARWRYDTGVTLSAGQSVLVSSRLEVSHVVPDFQAEDPPRRMTLFRPGQPDIINCRITAS